MTEKSPCDRSMANPRLQLAERLLALIRPDLCRGPDNGDGNLRSDPSLRHCDEPLRSANGAEVGRQSNDRIRAPFLLRVPPAGGREDRRTGNRDRLRADAGPFLDQNMGVDPTKAEAADGRAPRLSRGSGRPGLGTGQDAERAGCSNPEAGAGRSKFAVGGKTSMFQGQEHLDQPRGAGRREGMADVPFDRADHALTVRPAGLSPERLEALDLDGIAQRGPGGVAFDHVDVAGTPACLLVGHPHGPELALGAGSEQVAVDVVGQTDPGHDPVDVIPVTSGIGEPLEDEHPGPFADDQPVAAMVQRSRPASRRERRSCENPIWV